VDARLEVSSPALGVRRIGPPPAAARVRFRADRDVEALLGGDQLALGEAFLDGRVEVAGDLAAALRVTLVLDLRARPLERLRWLARWALDRTRWRRASVSFHYDRPADFFLPWMERWRSYSHGLYDSPDEPARLAQERKLSRAVEALALPPGARVLDVGCGWGSFLEYAGLRGIRVQGLTLSRTQRAFVADLVAKRGLPCQVALDDFFDHAPAAPYDGAVFMGSLEHLVDTGAVARRLRGLLRPGACVWADFCAQERDTQVGAFLARHVWPGTARYVHLPTLVRHLEDAGLRVLRVEDDTASYALTVRDWADALDARSGEMARAFGRREVRIFQLYLRASQVFFEARRSLAYHLVARNDGTDGLRGP